MAMWTLKLQTGVMFTLADGRTAHHNHQDDGIFSAADGQYQRMDAKRKLRFDRARERLTIIVHFFERQNRWFEGTSSFTRLC
jgi:hypothetical protein